jgi:O-antigen ligase
VQAGLAITLAVAIGLIYVGMCTVVSPLLAFCGVVGMFVSVLLLRDPRITFLLTAAMIPLERFGRFTSDSSNFTLSVMRLVGLLMLGAFVMQIVTRRMRLRFDTTILLYAVYASLTLLSIFYTTDFSGTVRANGMILSNLLYFFLAINLATDFKLVRQGAALWLIVTVLIGGYAIYDWTRGSVRMTDETVGLNETKWSTVWMDSSEWEAKLDNIPRSVGSSSHPAVYGINLVMALPFFVYFLRRAQTRWMRVLILLGLGITLYNVLLTNTRAVMLIAVVTLGLCWVGRMFRVRPSWIFAAAAVAVAALPFVDMSRFERILDPRNYTYSESRTLQIRTMYWKAGLGLVEDHWLLGMGVGNKNEIPKYVEGRVPEKTTVHNEFLMTLMEVGVSGWIVFFSFIGVLLYYCSYAARVFRRHGMEDEFLFARALQVVMIVVLMYGVQCDVFRFPLKGWWYCAAVAPLIYGLARAAARKELTPNQQEQTA